MGRRRGHRGLATATARSGMSSHHLHMLLLTFSMMPALRPFAACVHRPLIFLASSCADVISLHPQRASKMVRLHHGRRTVAMLLLVLLTTGGSAATDAGFVCTRGTCTGGTTSTGALRTGGTSDPFILSPSCFKPNGRCAAVSPMSASRGMRGWGEGRGHASGREHSMR